MYYYSSFRLDSVNPRKFEATCISTNDDPVRFLQVGASLFPFALCCLAFFTLDLHFPFSWHSTTRFPVCRILLCWQDWCFSDYQCVFLPCLFASRAANEIHRRLAGAVDALLFVLVAVARGNKSALYVTHITLIAANKQPRSGSVCLSPSFSFFSACFSSTK
jgi:hypothetical protein